MSDVVGIVTLLRDDDLGQGRESDDLGCYRDAFQRMEDEAQNDLIVGEAEDGRIVAVYQFTIITGLSQKGLRRALLEAIRVASDLRGQGIGQALMEDAEARSKAVGAGLMQLTSNKSRDRSHGFYRRLGYADTHVGFKKPL